MGARRPKPTQLKEPTQARPNFALSRLFAAANALVTVPSEKPQSKVRPKSSEAHEAALELTQTLRLQTQSSSVVQRSAVQQAAAQKAALRSRVARKRRPFQLKPFVMPFFLASLVLFLIAYWIGIFDGAFSSQPWASHGPPGALTSKQIGQRLAFHRDMTGTRLNRERIDVQIQNFKTAPALNGTDRKANVPTMMEGLPLAAEANTFTRDAKSDLVADPTFSEAKVGYGLQEEQYRAEFDQRAEKEWVHDFVENARRGGYDVHIDANGNVKTKLIPLEK